MFIEAKDDGGGGDNWTTGAIRCAKLQSNQQNHHLPQITNKPTSSFFYRPDALPVTNQQCQSTEGMYRMLYLRKFILTAFNIFYIACDSSISC